MIKIRTQQILLPKQVYIGDHAELRVSFSIDSQLIKNGINTMMQNGITELSLNNFESEVNSYEYEIKSIKLVSSSTGEICSCNFVIEFIPWRTGFIQLPDYNITKALTSSKEEYIPSDTDLAIHFEPLQIVSLIANNSSVALKGQASPLLLPGTIYWIYACEIALVLILDTLINLIVKHKKLALFIKNKNIERRYTKNRR